MAVVTLLFVSIVLSQGKVGNHAISEQDVSRWNDLVWQAPDKAIKFFGAKPWLIESRNGSDTPLIEASTRGSVKLVKWLMRHGAHINEQGTNGATALYEATGPVAKVLIRAGIRVTSASEGLGTAMQWAAGHCADGHRGREWETLCAIRDAGYPLDAMSALFLDDRDLARRLIRGNPRGVAGLRVNSWSALHEAASNGDVETARLLIDLAKMDADTPGFDDFYTPLVIAVARATPEPGSKRPLPPSRREMIRLLCERGANPNRLGRDLRRSLAELEPGTAAILRKYAAIRPQNPTGRRMPPNGAVPP